MQISRPPLYPIRFQKPTGQKLQRSDNGPRFGASFNTKIDLLGAPWPQVCADAMIIPVYKTQDGALPIENRLAELDNKLTGEISFVVKREKFDGAYGATRHFNARPTDGLGTLHLILVGLGDPEKLNPLKLEKVIASTLKDSSLRHASHVAMALPDPTPQMSHKRAVQAMVAAVHEATYRSAEAVKPGFDLDKVSIVTSSQPVMPPPSVLSPKVQTSEAIAKAVGFAKDLANSPYNKLNAADFAKKAIELADKYNKVLSAEVKTEDWIKDNMPAFYAVAQGAVRRDPPRFIKVTYKPESGDVKKKIAIIGKSVMYDTGGVQSKGDRMNSMKMDMTGGAYALGIMKALAELKPEGIQVTAYMAAAPNMADEFSYLPDDIIDSSVGKKIEIHHTDAEGRLTLIDAVTQASKEDPAEIITMATLTGAAARAFGKNVVLMTQEQDTALQEKLYKTAKCFGEPFETALVRDEDFEAITSKKDGVHIKNVGGESRGFQTAGAFVMSGIPDGKKIPLAHLDIAGVMGDGEGFSGGSTGYGVKTLVHYILNEAKALNSGTTP